MVTISDKAKSLVALVEAKEQLARDAAKCNEDTQFLIIKFQRMLWEASELQKTILDKMAAVDESIKKIAETC